MLVSTHTTVIRDCAGACERKTLSRHAAAAAAAATTTEMLEAENDKVSISKNRRLVSHTNKQCTVSSVECRLEPQAVTADRALCNSISVFSISHSMSNDAAKSINAAKIKLQK